MHLPSWKVLSARREVLPRTYAKQCFLMRSPSQTAQSTLDPTSWSKINPTHNPLPPPPKVCRQETATIIHHFIFYVIYSQLTYAHTFDIIFTSSSNTRPQNNRLWFLKASTTTTTTTTCHRSLTPQAVFVASDLWMSGPAELEQSSVRLPFTVRKMEWERWPYPLQRHQQTEPPYALTW